MTLYQRKISVAISVFSALLLLSGSHAKAGLILQHPTYTGLSSGLVGYWSFDGKDMSNLTAIDRSGNSNTGTLTNGPVRTIGKLGQALSFDGVNDYVLGPDNASLNFGTGNFAISLWFKTTDTDYGAFVNKGDTEGAQSPDYWLFRVTDVGALNFNTAENDLDTGLITATTGYNNNIWHHAVGYRNGTTVGIFIDGVDRGSTTGTIRNVSAQNTKALGIGMAWHTNIGGFVALPFVGSIDDVRIYNRALSPDEIKRLYKVGGTLHVNTQINNDSLTKGLVGYWSFDGKDMSNLTALDRSGNSNNGTLTNGPVRAIGKIGQALSFDGVNDYVQATAAPSLNNLGPLTASAWIKPNSAGGSGTSKTGRIVGKDGTQALAGSWRLFIVNSSVLSSCASTPTLALSFAKDNTGATTFANKCGADNTVTLGAWQHVVVTWDGTGPGETGIHIYKNGQEITYATAGASSGSAGDDSSLNLLIGNLSATNRPFDGSIDDVRVYNRALSGDEIKRLYNLGR